MPSPTVSTAEELLSLREPGVRHELVRGELRRMSPAGHWHGDVGARLSERLIRHVREQRLGKTYVAETGFLLTRNPDTVLAPDLAFVCSERLPPPRSMGFFPGPPDLAVEIRSPRDTRRDTHEKVRAWLEHGVRSVWVVDPAAGTVTIVHGTHDVRELRGDDELTDDVVPGFRLAVCELFLEHD
ncbi:MAG TPA: Uma2 family endonuclease [Planctomycetota bacterium]|nr:Uma2 family endonuclease [Planctomycetota bacterium]